MDVSGDDGRLIEDEVSALSRLTNYPRAVIRDIVEADRMYVLDRICDDMHETGFLPDSYSFDLPGYGRVGMRRLADGRTTSAKWSFLPSRRFVDGFFNSFYYGISPIYETMRGNFDSLLDVRRDNLLRVGDD